MRYIILDLETVPHPDAHRWAEPVKADSRLKDPVKIAESIREKTAERDERFGLDPDCNRIVALGWHAVGGADPFCDLMRDEFEERLPVVHQFLGLPHDADLVLFLDLPVPLHLKHPHVHDIDTDRLMHAGRARRERSRIACTDWNRHYSPFAFVMSA